ncbi:FAD:protein FMN transferase [Runella slithyformis]|uniref:FAD:protein FMN transferase n=1 Tax=Runella slithyformis (strain ATCC 29530 / DSM 19594 / LMG 11500 / NCIMB 11436 / LSU 4) TaxID=761193 RepID=A0A7U4E4H2_RUNSL|nr:FAD:protein FMN transferase [Runella slithyformis]AEI47143.1 ApbE family lipoprotein [Runella slithyformis DSM 19594]
MEQLHRRVLRLMGNRFEISVVAEDKAWAEARIDDAVSEIQRIEALLTTFSDNSQTNQINTQAGIAPVRVDREVFELIRRSLRISELTQGAFDITYGSIDKSLWNFDTHMTSLPDPETARRMVRLINYRNVILNEADGSVFLKEKGMRIGFGGIGKGYAAEMAKRLLQQKGVQSGIVNASGDLTAWGNQPNGQPWTIGIADPNAQSQPFSFLNISNVAVATSGNYEKYALIQGKKYSHTIDPKTGLPVAGIKSVTILSPNAEIADAMATPVTVMGVRVGLDLINQMQGMACVIIDDHDRVFTSKNIAVSR